MIRKNEIFIMNLNCNVEMGSDMNKNFVQLASE